MGSNFIKEMFNVVKNENLIEKFEDNSLKVILNEFKKKKKFFERKSGTWSQVPQPHGPSGRLT